MVPDLWFKSSQPTPSLAVQLSDVVSVLVSVTDAFVAVFPKSTWRGETGRVPDSVDWDSVRIPGMAAVGLESTSTGEELQAAAMAAHTMSIAARWTRMTWECT